MLNSDFKFGKQQLDLFKKNGFVHVKGLFPLDLVDEINEIVDKSKNLREIDGVIFDEINQKKYLRYVPQPQLKELKFNKLIHSNLLGIGQMILEDNVYFSGIDLHCREMGSEIPTPPHQDSFLACFQEGYENLVTCYVSLSGMNKDSANLRFIKGSHLKPTLNHKKSLKRGFSSVIEEDSNLLSSDLLNNEQVIILDKGECVFFHCKTIHYTNQVIKPTKKRSSAAIRLTGYGAKYSEEKRKIYEKNVKFNRTSTIEEGLTNKISKPQHS